MPDAAPVTTEVTTPAATPAPVVETTATPAPVVAPAASVEHATAPAAVAHTTEPGEAQNELHGAHEHSHAFNFDDLNASHNMPYSAIEWVHGHPALILNAAEYATVNYGRLSASEPFKTAQPDAGYQIWANEIAARATYKGVPAPELAKAMTVARDEAWLGSLPKALGFFNHQTFWSTIALILLALVLLVFARRRIDQVKPSGRIQHMIEALVLFVRDDIVRPNIKHHPDAWVPYFASMFLALLACNLFGLVPLFGTATGNIAVTTGLALTTAFLMLFINIKENGLVMFWIKLVLVHWSWHPGNMLLWFFLAFSEILQLFIRPVVLAIRLFANMLAGHSVLLVFATLGFIIYSSDHNATGMASTMGIFGWILTIPFYALELLVALLQAYIFTLLSAVFIGLCAHPEH
ncbi:MAG TPA: F0F1 ATP synthase subunit A [Planctomycetota bacterium]|nr:F0F1 ATP synthase subunit A [Planctomycetota bacterium]